MANSKKSTPKSAQLVGTVNTIKEQTIVTTPSALAAARTQRLDRQEAMKDTGYFAIHDGIYTVESFLIRETTIPMKNPQTGKLEPMDCLVYSLWSFDEKGEVKVLDGLSLITKVAEQFEAIFIEKGMDCPLTTKDIKFANYKWTAVPSGRFKVQVSTRLNKNKIVVNTIKLVN